MGLSKRLRPLGLRSIEEITYAKQAEQRWRDYQSGKLKDFWHLDSATDGRVQMDLFTEPVARASSSQKD